MTSPLASGMDSIAGTYCGVLPPDVETTLTLNADGTYLLVRTFKEKQNKQERLKGSFQVLDGNILMLVHPLSGDNIFYKVRDANHIILIDSFGNEPKKGNRDNHALIKKWNVNKLCLPIVVEHSLFYTRTKDGLLQIIVYKDILNSKHTKIIVAFCSIHLSILYHLV